SGTFNNDDITKVVNPVFDILVADPTAQVLLLREPHGGPGPFVVVGQRFGPGSVQDPGPVQPDGAYDYVDQLIDVAGNVSAFSAVLTVTFDIVPPPPPSTPVHDTG